MQNIKFKFNFSYLIQMENLKLNEIILNMWKYFLFIIYILFIYFLLKYIRFFNIKIFFTILTLLTHT